MMNGFQNKNLNHTMKIIIAFAFFCLSICNIYSQKQADTIVVEINGKTYLDSVKNHASIFSGRQEQRYIYKTTNHPYLDTVQFRVGTLSVDGCVYHDVALRLNQNVEELVILSPNRIFSVLVPREYLDYAIIDSLYIVYHKPVSADGKDLPEGYYVRVYNGETQVWKRKVSFLTSKVVSQMVEYMFESNTKRYILIDGSYYPVTNKNSVLKLFASKKKELKRMLKYTGLKYRDDPEKAIIALSRYYDELNK